MYLGAFYTTRSLPDRLSTVYVGCTTPYYHAHDGSDPVMGRVTRVNSCGQPPLPGECYDGIAGRGPQERRHQETGGAP